MRPPRLIEPLTHADGLCRCPWPGTDPLYVAYHDEEWGVPEWDDRALFEKLILDGFQAGPLLDHHPAQARGVPRRVRRLRSRKDRPLRRARNSRALMADPGIVRNRAKIEAAPALARVWLDLQGKGGFARHLWGFVDGRPIAHPRQTLADIPAASPEAEALSKDLKRARRQLRRADHRLRLHAGGRHGQRPSRRLPSPRGLRRTRPQAAVVKRRRGALAAHAVGAAARPDRPLAARRRDRRHRARPRPRRALERADAGRGDFLRRPAFAAGRGDLLRARRPTRRARRSWRRCCTTRRNM